MLQIQKCSNCYFICNLRYLCVQNVVTETEYVSELQKLCRLNYSSFYSLYLLLRSLGAIEREHIKLENKFHEVLRIWNIAPTVQNSQETSSKKNSWLMKKSRYGLVFLMLNILHHIQSSGGYYCYCEKIKYKCQMCVIPMIFWDFEKDIDQNIIDLSFLDSYYSKLCFEIMVLYDEEKSCIDFFLHQEYIFGGRDWTTGETWCVPRRVFDTVRASSRLSWEQTNCLFLLIKFWLFLGKKWNKNME